MPEIGDRVVVTMRRAYTRPQRQIIGVLVPAAGPDSITVDVGAYREAIRLENVTSIQLHPENER